MTGLQLLRILGRRWYLVVAALVLAGIAYGLLRQAAGPVYAAQTDVVFSAPGRGGLTASADGVVEGLVGLASAVQRDVGKRIPDPPLTTENATLFGSGVSRGYTITLPNLGNQWDSNYTDPSLTVSVVGPSPEWVRTTTDRLVQEVRTNAETRQIDANVPVESRIVTGRVPKVTSVSYVASTTSTDARAVVALAAIALAIAGTLAVYLERRTPRSDRRARRADPTAAASTDPADLRGVPA